MREGHNVVRRVLAVASVIAAIATGQVVTAGAANAVVQHTVHFVLNGGSDVGPAPADQLIDDGGLATAPAENPTLAGSEFLYWDTSQNGLGYIWDFSTSTVTQDWTLYARFTPPSECPSTGAGNLVVNCGFETGDKTGWTLTQPADFTGNAGVAPGQYMSEDGPHSGHYWFGLGATGDFDDVLSQQLATTPGSTYSVSFFLLDDETVGEPDFSFTVEDTASGDLTPIDLADSDPGPGVYDEFDTTFTAGPKPATIEFAGRHLAGWLNLDDVTVLETTPPPPPPPPPAAPTISVASSKSPAGPADTVTFTATLSPVPGCGSVTWLVDNAPASATASGSGGTFTLGPVSGLGIGTHPVTAVFSGCSTASGASGTVIEQVRAPTPSPSPGPVTNPTITAHVSSSTPKRDGWYAGPVHISFTCAPGSSPLSTPCPDPLTLSASKGNQSVTASVSDTDGGTASTTVMVSIDAVAPSLTVHPRAGTCTATDDLSGEAACVVHKHRTTKHGVTTVRWTAIGTDNAGNTATKTGSYRP